MKQWSLPQTNIAHKYNMINYGGRLFWIRSKLLTFLFKPKPPTNHQERLNYREETKILLDGTIVTRKSWEPQGLNSQSKIFE